MSWVSASTPSLGRGRPLISSPAQNARPLPVITTTRTRSSICACVIVSMRSRFIGCVVPLSRSGWFMVIRDAGLVEPDLERESCLPS
jgi:hypothetical protein